MRDMRSAGVEIFTLGQYLRPSKRHMPVARMLPPEEYEMYREMGLREGFKYVASGPLVRSSYKVSRGGARVAAQTLTRHSYEASSTPIGGHRVRNWLCAGGQHVLMPRILKHLRSRSWPHTTCTVLSRCKVPTLMCPLVAVDCWVV